MYLPQLDGTAARSPGASAAEATQVRHALRAEVRRRRDGLHVREQRHGECVAERAEDGFVRLSVPVELVRCAEEGVRLGHGYAGYGQPAAAVRRGDGGRWHAVVLEPGPDEHERVWVRRNELGDLLLGQVRAVSTQQHT